MRTETKRKHFRRRWLAPLVIVLAVLFKQGHCLKFALPQHGKVCLHESVHEDQDVSGSFVALPENTQVRLDIRQVGDTEPLVTRDGGEGNFRLKAPSSMILQICFSSNRAQHKRYIIIEIEPDAKSADKKVKESAKRFSRATSISMQVYNGLNRGAFKVRSWNMANERHHMELRRTLKNLQVWSWLESFLACFMLVAQLLFLWLTFTRQGKPRSGTSLFGPAPKRGKGILGV
mmetsp:Transcript_12478/g.38061  ORF Transcript_12478/g.38061 Transcript_12478/m.38061 type:complete len:232 (-) Transcript_12478:1444-2139(-)